MTYPPSWKTVPVTGTYIGTDGNPCSGTVQFVPQLLLLRAGTVEPPAPVTVTLDSSGAFSTTLAATDDADASPTGWVWRVYENVPGGRQGFPLAVPQASAGIDLSTAVPALPNPQTWNPYTGVTAAQLADQASGATGAGMVGYLAPGEGAVGRTVQDRLQAVLSVKDFGAVGDGTTDDTAAIQSAITQAETGTGPRRVYFPLGTYKVTSGFSIAHTVRLVGEGAGSPAFESQPAEPGSHILYDGDADSTMTLFSFTDVNFGHAGMEGIWVDCNGLAGCGVLLDGVTGASFIDLRIDNFTVWGLKLTGTTNTCSWNTFLNLGMNTGSETSGTKAAIWLSGVTGGANATHCLFLDTQINCAGAFHGIYLGGCDNITFVQTYIYRAPGGTGFGVQCDFSENGTESAFPGACTFHHLEAMAGYNELAATPARSQSSAPSSVIYGYQTDNGEPLPVSADGAPIPCMDNWGTWRQANQVGTLLTVTAGTQINPRNFATVLLVYTAATTVTDILGGQPEGARVGFYQDTTGAGLVTFAYAVGASGTEIYTQSAANVTLAAGQYIEFMKIPAGWMELGRNFPT